jgi:secondary thiamine-phosphate synthase enzyme
MPQKMISLSTRGQGLYEFTEEVSAFVRVRCRRRGLLTVFVRHTSCSLLIQENADPDVQTDLNAFFRRLVPPSSDPSMRWIVHTMEGPDDMPAHIKAALTQVSIGIPVMNGRLALGTWQGIYLFEHRESPHRREVVLHLGATEQKVNSRFEHCSFSSVYGPLNPAREIVGTISRVCHEHFVAKASLRRPSCIRFRSRRPDRCAAATSSMRSAVEVQYRSGQRMLAGSGRREGALGRFAQRARDQTSRRAASSFPVADIAAGNGCSLQMCADARRSVADPV